MEAVEFCQHCQNCQYCQHCHLCVLLQNWTGKACDGIYKGVKVKMMNTTVRATFHLTNKFGYTRSWQCCVFIWYSLPTATGCEKVMFFGKEGQSPLPQFLERPGRASPLRFPPDPRHHGTEPCRHPNDVSWERQGVRAVGLRLKGFLV